MYKTKEYWIVLLIVSCIIFPLGFEFDRAILDFVTYNETMKSTYETPWYSNNWLEQPYTNFMLSGHTNHMYWTINGTGSQYWLCDEVFIKNKHFWTILKHQDITK